MYNSLQQINAISIDMPELVARKSAMNLWGDGFNLTAEKKELRVFLNKLKSTSKMENILYANEKVLSKHGMSIISISRTKGGEYRFNIADPRMTNKVGRVSIDEVSAVIWIKRVHDNHMYWIKEQWDTQKVTRTLWDQSQESTLDVMGYNAKVPQHLQIEKVWHHNLSVLPLVEFHNLPDINFDMLWEGYNPDDRAVASLKGVVDNLLIQMVKESILNKTRALGFFTPEKMAEIKATASDELKMLVDDFLLQVELPGGNGEDPLEIMQGDPKFTQYLEAISKVMELYFNGCGYEWDKGESASAQTATGSMLGKGRDVETTKEKRRQRTIDVSRLIDRVLQVENFMESPYDEREYVFEIKENLVVDEFKRLETLKAGVEAGLIPRITAVAKLNGTDEKGAEELITKIDEEMTAQMQQMEQFNKPQEEDKPREE